MYPKSDAMKCTHYHQQMSQCLDGRLPAGSRTLLLAHIDQCEICTREWSSLNAAQDLALKLPSIPVSAGFRDSLWDRIRAGEAGPDVAAMDPLSPWTRVRWFAAGVSAAAAVLVLTHLLQGEGPAPDSLQRENLPTEVARVDSDPPSEVAPPRTQVGLPGGQLVPLNAESVARLGAATAYRSARQLRDVADTLERGDQSHLRDVTGIRAEVAHQANEFMASTRLMRWMHDSEIIGLPNHMLEQIGRIESSLSSFEQANSIDEMRLALRGLHQARPEQLAGRFNLVSCSGCDIDLQFQKMLNERIQRDPGAARVIGRMHIVVRPQGSGTPGDQPGIFVLRFDEGSSPRLSGPQTAPATRFELRERR
jgi:hypothetical protein